MTRNDLWASNTEDLTAHLERRKQAELPKELVIIYISCGCGFPKLFHER